MGKVHTHTYAHIHIPTHTQDEGKASYSTLPDLGQVM